MNHPPASPNALPRIAPLFLVLAILWTLLVGASLGWNLYRSQESAMASVRTQARIAIDKDVLYRRWNAMHGAVYAMVTEKTPPNPYLHTPQRDIATPDHKQLTQINPAYMTRQVHELGALSSGVLGHITSLNPLRPQNKPDVWETAALKALHEGKSEASEVTDINGTSYLRLMRPLLTEKPCLACHASQGYKEGEIRGAISVSVPMAPVMDTIRQNRLILIITHAACWLAFLAVMVLGAHKLHRQGVERDRALEKWHRENQRSQRLEVEKAKLEGVLEMSAAAAHEISQPLQVIVSSVEFLKQEKPGGELHQTLLDDLEESSDRLKSVVHKVQTITRYASKQYTEGTMIVDLDRASSQGGPDSGD